MTEIILAAGLGAILFLIGVASWWPVVIDLARTNLPLLILTLSITSVFCLVTTNTTATGGLLGLNHLLRA